jgi:hypothetical protein
VTAIPPGRGRWVLTIHKRSFTDQAWTQTLIAEVNEARGRRLEVAWNKPASLTFTLDGNSPAAALVAELETDVRAWRWDEPSGQDVCLFRGLVTAAEDQLTEQSATVTFTAVDYLAMLDRRLITQTLNLTADDQDDIAAQLIGFRASASDGTSFAPGDYLPIRPVRAYPDGTLARPLSGVVRDRTYLGSQAVGQALADLAAVISGFDFALQPAPHSLSEEWDQVRVYFPSQGVARNDVALIYGATVATLTRSNTSTNYANYQRALGNNSGGGPQSFGEAWNGDANDVTRIPIGLWQTGGNWADVKDNASLLQKAQGDLNLSGALVPTYTVGLTPGTYTWGRPNVGDTVPLIVQRGRLDIDTTVRVMGISFDIGEDGNEDVILTLGRPAMPLTELIVRPTRDINAIARR